MKTKVCCGKNSCRLEKSIECFYFKNDINKYTNNCKECVSKSQKTYYINNKERIKKRVKKYNKDKKSLIDKKYKENNKERLKLKNKEYYERNKEEIKKKRNIYNKQRRKNDPNFKLRISISRTINKILKINYSSKKGYSILEYLPFTIKELKLHIENQFSLPHNLDYNGKVWMNWERWGKQRKDFDPNNSETWMFHIDHIIPQSQFPFNSMTHANFKKCWALNNLQPMRSDLNLKKSNK